MSRKGGSRNMNRLAIAAIDAASQTGKGVHQLTESLGSADESHQCPRQTGAAGSGNHHRLRTTSHTSKAITITVARPSMT
jgi:hypothetical protein